MACLSGVNNSPWIPIKEFPEEDEVISEDKTFTCVPLIVFVEYSLSFAKTGFIKVARNIRIDIYIFFLSCYLLMSRL